MSNGGSIANYLIYGSWPERNGRKVSLLLLLLFLFASPFLVLFLSSPSRSGCKSGPKANVNHLKETQLERGTEGLYHVSAYCPRLELNRVAA